MTAKLLHMNGSKKFRPIIYLCSPYMKLKISADMIGIGTSVACAIHCAVLPVFLSSLPVFGVNIIHNFWFELLMILLAFVVGVFSLRHGFVRHHRSPVPFLLFIAGMLFLFAKQFLHDYELILLFFAVILIIFAHFFNFRYIRDVCKNSEAQNQKLNTAEWKSPFRV
jgi:predicted membrane protein